MDVQPTESRGKERNGSAGDLLKQEDTTEPEHHRYRQAGGQIDAKQKE